MTFLFALASVAQSIVLIASSVQGGAKTGTGFAISSTPKATRILTAAHVVEGSAAPLVFIGGPHGQRFSASILRYDRLRDVALLEIALGNVQTLRLGEASPPISGTAIQVIGFPTLREPASMDKLNPSPSPVPIIDLEMTPVDGKTDGVAEQGESILLDTPITHGDSGAPIIDKKTNRVLGMVLGLAAGYGVARWMGGDGLGLSVAGINAFLGQMFPATVPITPTYSVAMTPNTNPDVIASRVQLVVSAGFVLADVGPADPCRKTANGPPSANAVIDEEGDTSNLMFEVTDCSGAPFYRDGMTTEHGGIHDLVRLVGRTFLGYIDTHPAEWASLLKFGIAVDAKKNPYLALMSVQRNPYGQLIVAHVFHGGPAALAGLMPGDAILKIDGRPTHALGDPFVARLLNQPTVTLLVSRNEKESLTRIRLRRFADLTAVGPVPH
jgi:S1-C subfamily serine protease